MEHDQYWSTFKTHLQILRALTFLRTAFMTAILSAESRSIILYRGVMSSASVCNITKLHKIWQRILITMHHPSCRSVKQQLQCHVTQLFGGDWKRYIIRHFVKISDVQSVILLKIVAMLNKNISIDRQMNRSQLKKVLFNSVCYNSVCYKYL